MSAGLLPFRCYIFFMTPEFPLLPNSISLEEWIAKLKVNHSMCSDHPSIVFVAVFVYCILKSQSDCRMTHNHYRSSLRFQFTSKTTAKRIKRVAIVAREARMYHRYKYCSEWVQGWSSWRWSWPWNIHHGCDIEQRRCCRCRCMARWWHWKAAFRQFQSSSSCDLWRGTDPWLFAPMYRPRRGWWPLDEHQWRNTRSERKTEMEMTQFRKRGNCQLDTHKDPSGQQNHSITYLTFPSHIFKKTFNMVTSLSLSELWCSCWKGCWGVLDRTKAILMDLSSWQ